MDLVNETFLASICFFIVTFTNFASNEESKVLVAWVFNIQILLMLTFNIAPIIKESIRLLEMSVQKYSRLYCH